MNGFTKFISMLATTFKSNGLTVVMLVCAGITAGLFTSIYGWPTVFAYLAQIK